MYSYNLHSLCVPGSSWDTVVRPIRHSVITSNNYYLRTTPHDVTISVAKWEQIMHTGIDLCVLLSTATLQITCPLHTHCRNGEPLHIYFNDVYGPVIPAISFCRNKSLTLRFPPFPVKMSSEAGALLSPTLPGQRDGGSPLGQREGRSSPIPIPDNAGSRSWICVFHPFYTHEWNY